MAYDPIKEINRLKELQRKQALSSLDKAKSNSLANLTAERNAVKPVYYNKRNETSTNSQIASKNFAEYMAGRGTQGTNAQAQLLSNIGLQNNLTSLNREEANKYADISQRETGVKNQYELDLVDAYNKIEADAAQQTMAAKQRLDDIARAAASARRSGGGGSGRRSSSGSSGGNNAKDMAWASFAELYNQPSINKEGDLISPAGQTMQWLKNSKDGLIGTIGKTEYNKMVKQWYKNEEAKRTYGGRARAYNQLYGGY